MNNNNPNAADAPVPPEGTEHAVDQAAKQQQQQPPADSGAMDFVGSVVEGVVDVAGAAIDILSIFE